MDARISLVINGREKEQLHVSNMKRKSLANAGLGICKMQIKASLARTDGGGL